MRNNAKLLVQILSVIQLLAVMIEVFWYDVMWCDVMVDVMWRDVATVWLVNVEYGTHQKIQNVRHDTFESEIFIALLSGLGDYDCRQDEWTN